MTISRQEHDAIKNNILYGRQSKKDNTGELINNWLESMAYRYYQYEKIIGFKVTLDTPFSRILSFELMIKRDPQYKTKGDD